MVSTTVQTILDNLTSFDNWTIPLAVENLTLSLVNTSFVPKINGFDDGPQFPAYIRTPSMVLCSIILCIGVLGNIMVPCVILKSKDMRNSTNIFLMNLSIADLMVLLVCTPTVLVEVNSKPETWQMGEHMCKAVPFVELTVAHASVLTILAISFERYYAICEPLKAGYVCTKTRAIVICLLAWGFAALFTSPITWITEYKHAQYFDNSIVPVCLTQAEKMWPATYFVLIILIFFILPLILLIVLYAIIAKNLMAEINNTNDNNIYNQRARRQVVTMLALVVLSFFLCLLPFRIITLWIVIIPDDNVYSIKKLTLITYYKVLFISRILLYLNSAINPILYNIMSSKFRKGFKKLIGIRNVNHRKFTYTGTLTTTMNSSNQSSTRRLLMTQKSTPNFYNDDSNSFKNKNLYRQSTDSMLFDKRNKNLQMLKNSGSFQTKSKDFDELLNKTCRQCGTTLEEFCKHCRKIVNKSLLDQHTKAKKVCHCEQSIDKNDKNNYLYCKNCEIFANNRINKAKHSLDASLSTCSRLPINILIQTFDSFDNSPILLKKFNDEKQKEKLRIEMDKTVNDETKDAQQPLLNTTVVEEENKTSTSPALSRDYDNLTDIEEDNIDRSNQKIHDNKNCFEPKIADHLKLNSDNITDLVKLERIELEAFSVQPVEKSTYDMPKIPVSEADKKRNRFSSILKKSNKKLVTKKSNVSFDLENLTKVVDNDSIDNNNCKNLHDKEDKEFADGMEDIQQGRFSIHRTSVYDNVDDPYDTHDIFSIGNNTNDAENSISVTEANISQGNSNIGMNRIESCNKVAYLNKTSCFDYESDKSDPSDSIGTPEHKLHSKNLTSDLKSNNNTHLLNQIIGEPIDMKPQPSDICDKHINLHSNSFEINCDSKDPQFDEIHGKIENSIQLLDKIAISCTSKEYSNKTDQSSSPNHLNNVSRNIMHPQTLTVTESSETLMTTNLMPLSSLIKKMPTVIEELSPVSPICDNKTNSSSIVEHLDQVMAASKFPCQSSFGAYRYQKSLRHNSTGMLNDLSSSNNEDQLVENLRQSDTTSKSIQDYSQCNGSSTVHKSKDLKCQINKPKFPSNIIKKMKNKKSYDDIRIEMKRRKSRKKPKLRRENSFDLGDLDFLKVPQAFDILVPFSFSNSESNVKDLITSQQTKSSTPTPNNVLINLFDLKDSNEETFV